MWDLNYKEGRALKNWYFQNVVLEKTLESPWDCKEIKLFNPKGNQPWIGRIDAETEAPILWPSDVKSRIIRKDPDAGKDCGQKEKGATEDGMVGWHHWLNEHEFEQGLGDGEGQGSLACCSSWGCKESDRLSNCTITTSLSQEDRSILDTRACICSKNGLLCVVYFWVSVCENTCFCLCLH